MKTLKYLTNIFLDSFCGFSKKGKDRMRVLKILASFSDNGSIVVVRKYLILLYSARHLKKKILKNLNKQCYSFPNIAAIILQNKLNSKQLPIFTNISFLKKGSFPHPRIKAGPQRFRPKISRMRKRSNVSYYKISQKNTLIYIANT